MKKFEIIWSIILIFVLQALVLAQSSNNALNHSDSLLIQTRTQLHQSVYAWDEKKMLQNRAMFERLLILSSYPWLVHYYIALVDLHLSQYYSAEKNKAERFVDEGIEHLNKCIELKKHFADAFALLANFYGMKISISPFRGIDLGSRSSAVLRTAEKLKPENPRLHLIAGTSALFTPKVFGGGNDKAVRSLKKAARLFETYQPPSPLYPNWGHENTYAWLGNIAVKQDSLELAKKYFHKALEINPDYSWVKIKLLPQLEQKNQKRESAVQR